MGEEIGKGCGHAADIYDHALDPVAVDFPACVAFQVDVGFGDAVTPAPETIELPTIIDLPTPTLWAYAAEKVIAEKAIAMVDRGLLNTRLKDDFDLLHLSRVGDFEAAGLSRALVATSNGRA